VALTYATDYYIKIATTNGTDTSAAVSASGNPVMVGQVGTGDIVAITADKIITGTLQSGSTITVGAPGGKRVEIRGTGNPFEIYGTGGTSLLKYDTSANKLTIKGDGEFSGDIAAATGTLTNALNVGAIADGVYPFSVGISGILRAASGKVGGWTITGSLIHSATGLNSIEMNADTPKISLKQSGVEKITIDPVEGIVGPNITINSITSPSFILTPQGSLTIRGSITAGSSITGTTIIGSSFKSTNYDINPGSGLAIDATGLDDALIFNRNGTQVAKIRVLGTYLDMFAENSYITIGGDTVAFSGLTTSNTFTLNSSGAFITNGTVNVGTAGTGGGDRYLRNIRVDTVGPSGGVNGEVWLRYTA